MAASERSHSPSPISRVLDALELTYATVVALAVGWVGIWVVRAVIGFDSLAAIAATACWLAFVLMVHAWHDLVDFDDRWEKGAYDARMAHVHYRWWLAPPALVAGVLLAYWKW
jgi:hypothetical protein